MKKALILLLFVSFCLCSCNNEKSAYEIFRDFCEACALPDGTIYRSDVPSTDAAYLTKESFDRLYARADKTSEADEIAECVVWLGSSGESIYEMGIFRCRDREKAEKTVLMCQRRLALIRSLRVGDLSCAEDAYIGIYGTTVVFSVLPDNQKAERIFKRIL